ncbi:hypothetical protein NMY22_g15182 [Coprinellus aureogranulatus]|nr:hypothetical protein NMY22_g15182 [Coprinellus aureogranulatus]
MSKHFEERDLVKDAPPLEASRVTFEGKPDFGGENGMRKPFIEKIAVVCAQTNALSKGKKAQNKHVQTNVILFEGSSSSIPYDCWEELTAVIAVLRTSVLLCNQWEYSLREQNSCSRGRRRVIVDFPSVLNECAASIRSSPVRSIMPVWPFLLATAATLLLADHANALLRFPCAQLVTERFDPLVTPGQVSPHVHQILGGNAFNLTMDPSLDLPSLATCTTCRFKENKSNYWTAVMYFKHTNGSYLRVPQIPNHFTGSPNGGMTVYYAQHPDGHKITAFPKGFRMITGDPMLRSFRYTDNTTGDYWGKSFRCWQTTGPYDYSNSHAIGPGPFDTVHLPKAPCPGGIRSNTFFPACWDGVNLDTPDHSSHSPTIGPSGSLWVPYEPVRGPMHVNVPPSIPPYEPPSTSDRRRRPVGGVTAIVSVRWTGPFRELVGSAPRFRWFGVFALWSASWSCWLSSLQSRNSSVSSLSWCRYWIRWYVGFMVSTSPVRWLHLFMESDTWIHRSCRTEIRFVEWDMGDILAFGELIVYTDGQTSGCSQSPVVTRGSKSAGLSQSFFPKAEEGVRCRGTWTLEQHTYIHTYVAFYKNVDPTLGVFVSHGTCPESHPVHIPALFFETVWDTKELNKLWPEGAEQPYVLSMGDPTGYGRDQRSHFPWAVDEWEIDVIRERRRRIGEPGEELAALGEIPACGEVANWARVRGFVA